MSTQPSPRRLSRRTLLLIIVGLASATWGGLLLLTYFVGPTSVAAILSVFLLLSLALSCTCVLVTYLVLQLALRRQGRIARLSQALREGGLTAAWLLFNLILSTLHSWSIFTALVSCGIIVVIELLILGQK